MKKQDLINNYVKLSKADKMVVGIEMFKSVYAIEISVGDFDKYFTYDKYHDGLRFRPCTSYKYDLIMSDKAIVIGSRQRFKELHTTTKYNRGDVFERMYYDYCNQQWNGHDNKPFYKGGDINVDGLEIQLKFYGATIVRAETLDNLLNK